MRKILAMLLLATSSFTYADITGMEVDSPKELNTNSSAYFSVFLTDENYQPATDVTPSITSTPEYPVDLSDFVSCESAEWREICWEMDESLVGLKWAYVAEIKTKDVEEAINITILSDTSENPKVHTETIVIWSAETWSEASSTIEYIEDVPAVGGNNLKGIYTFSFIIFSIICFMIFALIREKNNFNS